MILSTLWLLFIKLGGKNMKYTDEISLLEKRHELEMEKLRYVRKTELLILERQWELNHSQPQQYYPQQQSQSQTQRIERQLAKEELEDEDDTDEEQDKYEKSKKQFNKKEAKK